MTSDPTGGPSDPLPAQALADLWQGTLDEAERRIGRDHVEQWMRGTELLALSGGVARVAAPTRFLSDWIERHYAPKLLECLCTLLPGVTRITLVPPEAPAARDDRPGPARRAAAPAAAAADGPELPSAPLDPRFTFESFVVGKSNELAHAAARRVAESCDASFNPVFLYGGVGLGKTHLMHAIGRHLADHQPGKKVLYLSAERFMYQFVQALRSRDMIGFKTLFRSVDVLMIDDVQFIAGKDSTQDEFFHTFNALVDQSKQLVISGDRSPDSIDGMEERIKSRLQWGLVVDIHPADYELRLGILQQKAEAIMADEPGIAIEQKVLEFLAHRISTNVRALEGALTRLFAFASLVGRRIDLDLTQECLADLLRSSERKLTIEDIKRKVCDHYNLRPAELTSARRARAVARPRQVAMYLCKTLTPRSLPEIGRGFGGRDHTTVIHAVRKIEELRATDSQLDEDVERLRRILEA